MDNKVVQWVTRSTPLESKGTWKKFVQERKGFDKGGLATPKRGLVDEPGSYAGKVKVLDEKTFRELYEKFPGGTDPEFLEFIKKEEEAKGIEYTGRDGAELNPRNIQNRRQNVLRIPKKGGLAYKISPKEFKNQAKELGINTRGLTDEEIRRKVQNKKSLLAVQKRFAEDPEYRESKRARTKLAQEKFKTNDPEKYRKYLESVQESRIKSGRMITIPTEFTPKGYFWKDLVFNANEFKTGRLKNSHIKYASPNTKIPKTADATKKIKLIDTNVKDPKTGKSKVLTYDTFLKHIDDNQNIYRIDSKTALGEYGKKEFINKNPDLKKGLIKELYGIDIADKDLYEGGTLKKGIAPYKRAPFHIHHTAGRGANAFNVQFAVGSDNIEEGRARKIFDTDFKLAKNFGEQKAAVKKYLDSVPENLEVRLKNTPYGKRETLLKMTERVAPSFSKKVKSAFSETPSAMKELMSRTSMGIDPTLLPKAAYQELVKPAAKFAGKAVNVGLGPTGLIGLNVGLGVDPTQAMDRIGIAGEAALAKPLVQGSLSVTDKIKTPLLRKIAERASLAGMSPAMALRAARIASPLGLASLGVEGLYHLGKAGYNQYKLMQDMSEDERREFLAQQYEDLGGVAGEGA